MATLKRNAKVSFANALLDVKEAFKKEMEFFGNEVFAQVLIDDKGFDKALHKAQLKFNDMVNDYLIKEQEDDGRYFDAPKPIVNDTIVVFTLLEENIQYGYAIVNGVNHGFNLCLHTGNVELVDALGKVQEDDYSIIVAIQMEAERVFNS